MLGGTGGENNFFTVSYKDQFRNPTQNREHLRISYVLRFMDVESKDTPLFSSVLENLEVDYFNVSYNVTRAGTYIMDVYVQITETSLDINRTSGKNVNQFILNTLFVY